MGNVFDINADNWEQKILKSDILTVVDFWHDHCSWCLKLDPILNDVSEDYKGKIKLAKLNLLENPKNREIAIRYGVMGTPTLVFFCAGRPVEQVVGFMSKERLKKKLDDMLETHKDCIKQSTKLEI